MSNCDLGGDHNAVYVLYHAVYKSHLYSFFRGFFGLGQLINRCDISMFQDAEMFSF